MNTSEEENLFSKNDEGWPWTKVLFCTLFCLLIVLVVVGNTLVILSVITTRRLRTVTNCFVMSLAVADWLVGVFVMPPAVFVFLTDGKRKFDKFFRSSLTLEISFNYLLCVGFWPLGHILCKIWISLDVLLCTASILSLCAISIDRWVLIDLISENSRIHKEKEWKFRGAILKRRHALEGGLKFFDSGRFCLG